MCLSILRDIVLEAIKSSDYQSIMANKFSDVSKKEQDVLCVCWVDGALIFDEGFIGLYEIEKTDTTSMVTVIRHIILRFGLDGEKLQGQCYHGRSTIMGKKEKS